MAETLLTPSGIKLYGRIMSSLQYYDDTSPTGNNNFLQRQLSAAQPKALPGPVDCTITAGRAKVAFIGEAVDEAIAAGVRIGRVVTAIAGKNQVFPPGTHIVEVNYRTDENGEGAAIPASFELSAAPSEEMIKDQGKKFSLTLWDLGVYLARIFAFSFEGGIYSMPKPAIFVVHGVGDRIDLNRLKGGRSSVDQSGVVAREWEFAGAPDLNFWEYERSDFSLRIDTDSGPFDQLLLQASLRSGADRADRSGASLDVRSGASLSGASPSGASLSGASLSGASLSGASLKR